MSKKDLVIKAYIELSPTYANRSEILQELSDSFGGDVSHYIIPCKVYKANLAGLANNLREGVDIEHTLQTMLDILEIYEDTTFLKLAEDSSTVEELRERILALC